MLGGNLSEILDRIARTMQERNRIQRQINTLTAQGRLSALIVGLMPFFLLVVLQIIDPGTVAPLFNTLIGQIILFTACLLVGLGWLMIRKLIIINI